VTRPADTSGNPIAAHPEGTVVEVWVVPGASRAQVVGLHGGAIRVRVTAPAAGGKANRAVEKLLAEVSGAHGGELIAGATSRRKRVVLRGIPPEQARSQLM
jgi:uncharacterized protein (TIGR00251 family)